MAVQIRLSCKNLQDGSVSEFTSTLPVTIGRSGEFSNVVIDDKKISRQHTRLEMEQNDLIVRDLKSANGTYVNAERVEQTTLKTGDIITISSYEISWDYIHPASFDATMLNAPLSDATVLHTIPSALKLDRKIPEPESPAAPLIPARKVIEEASAYNRERGHENDGFLSTEYGFMPAEPPLLQLPASHHVWDD